LAPKGQPGNPVPTAGIFLCEWQYCLTVLFWEVPSRDEHGSGLDWTAIFLKIGGSGLDRTEKDFDVFM